jgi:NADH-quinone oxidoreductase subunit C
MTLLSFDAMAELVRARFPGVEAQKSDNGQPYLLVKPAELPAVAKFARDAAPLRCDALMDLTGYDLLKYPATPPDTAIAVVYLLFSYQHRHQLTLKVHAPREQCAVGTVSAVWPAALYFEREVWDLLGVRFEGHPSLHRIMTPQDWEGHPLRKDYEYPQGYHGVAHLREGQHFESAPRRHGDPAPAAAPPTKKAHPA